MLHTPAAAASAAQRYSVDCLAQVCLQCLKALSAAPKITLKDHRSESLRGSVPQRVAATAARLRNDSIKRTALCPQPTPSEPPVNPHPSHPGVCRRERTAA